MCCEMAPQGSCSIYKSTERILQKCCCILSAKHYQAHQVEVPSVADLLAKLKGVLNDEEREYDVSSKEQRP